MAKLIFSLDGAFLGDILLNQARVSIGRRPTNDIHIDNLAVSGEHAAITSTGNDYFLEDLGSTNGTIVNGKAVTKHLMQHGDVIALGKYQLKYVNDTNNAQATHQQALEKAVDMRASAMESVPPITSVSAAPATPVAPAAGASASQASTAKLQVLNGANMGKELLLSKAFTTLGKPGVQVAVITKRPQGYFVTHVEGAVYPSINGISVGAQAHPLSDHDVLELAGIKMAFYCSPSELNCTVTS
jgi:pSer/pThr/pTyr-binding forkhead associated (FHA) protein